MEMANRIRTYPDMLIGFTHQRVVFDDEGQPYDFFFTDVNEAFEKLSGLKREDIIGKSVTEVMFRFPDSEFDWIGILGRVAITGISVQLEHHSELLGRWYSFLAYRPERGTVITFFIDITKRKRAEKQLKMTTKNVMLYLDLVSYDVSNQLQIIIYCNEILREELISSNLTYLNDLTDEAVQKCERIISKIRSTEKIGITPLLE